MSQNPDPSASHGPGAVAGGPHALPARKAGQRVFRVVMAGLSARDQRLAKVLMHHDSDPVRRFELADPSAALPPVILVANPFDSSGVRAIAAARSQSGIIAVVHAVPSHANAQTRFTLELERLSLDLMPCLKQVVELAFEASQPGETLFRVSGASAATARAGADTVPAPEEAVVSEQVEEEDQAVEERVEQETGLIQRCDALVVDANDQRAAATLAVFAESTLTARRCAPEGVLGAVANWQADLVVLAPDQTGFDLALALSTQKSGRKEGAAADVVTMMWLDSGSLMTYARAKLAGCSIVMTRPVDPLKLMNVLSKPLRRLRDRRRAAKQNRADLPQAGFSTPWLDTGTGH